MGIDANHTAPYQNLPPSYTSALHSDNIYMSLPLNESDSCRPIQTSSSNRANRTSYNSTSFAANHHANSPIHNLNSFDEQPLGQQPNERNTSQYHPLTVDLPPAYSEIIK